MDNELTGQFCVDESDVWRWAEKTRQEVRALRGEDDGKNLVFKYKGEDGEKCYDADTSQQHMTQFFKMVPLSQGNGNFSLLIIHLIAFYLCRTFAFPLFNSEVVHNSGIIIRSVDSCP